MTILGKYCKGFPLRQLRQFPGWYEEAQNARLVTAEVAGEVVETPRKLADGDYVYVQRNLTVTDGIFIDQNIIFSNVTPEWIEFCRNVLKFESDGDTQ